MNKKLKILCILFSMLFMGEYAFPQSWYGDLSPNDCGTIDISTSPILTDIGGYLKPERTDLSNGVPSDPLATFKMLFVFIQFQNEINPSYGEWPAGSGPVYMNSLFASQKVQTGNYWERYNSQTQLLSDYYMEISRGTLDVTGITRSIILDHPLSYYPGGYLGYNTILNEVYGKLAADITINWYQLDQWKKNLTTGLFENVGDNYIDMIGLIFRSVPITGIFPTSEAGYVPLMGPEYQLPNNKLIGPYGNEFGSGFVCKGKDFVNNKARNIGICIHEIGHYLFSFGHSTSGIMTSRGGLSLNDLFYSGFERMKLGYILPTTVNFGPIHYLLDDVSGRDGNTTLLLKVPISSTEFFLVENRRKLSQYDVYTIGDTVRCEPFTVDALDKGKGLFIYHAMSGLNYSSNVDIECADGLWNWSDLGTTTPDWSNDQQVQILARTSLPNPVNNDDGSWNSNINKDGVSAYQVYFTMGKRHTYVGECGTIKNYTNTPGWWTSRELWGDRFDAWNLGYNQIFSPYSNPNTKNNSNNQTGIFIYYENLIGNKAQVSVYKIGENGMTEDQILRLTPPSKPMGLEVDPCYPQEMQSFGIRLTWQHNQEPDMTRESMFIPPVKRYKIYRSVSNDVNSVPPDKVFFPETVYNCIATVDIDAEQTPEYIDNIGDIISICNTIPDYCHPLCYRLIYARYRVQAVDKYESQSTLSDFAQCPAYKVVSGGGIPIEPGQEDNIVTPKSVPENYYMAQNYPNPFNPVTRITYALPNDGFVTLKIFDILGREVATIVNEVKTAGYYTVDFDASRLSSGIYFYKLQSGTFTAVKRMVLVR